MFIIISFKFMFRLYYQFFLFDCTCLIKKSAMWTIDAQKESYGFFFIVFIRERLPGGVGCSRLFQLDDFQLLWFSSGLEVGA